MVELNYWQQYLIWFFNGQTRRPIWTSTENWTGEVRKTLWRPQKNSSLPRQPLGKHRNTMRGNTGAFSLLLDPHYTLIGVIDSMTPTLSVTWSKMGTSPSHCLGWVHGSTTPLTCLGWKFAIEPGHVQMNLLGHHSLLMCFKSACLCGCLLTRLLRRAGSKHCAPLHLALLQQVNTLQQQETESRLVGWI